MDSLLHLAPTLSHQTLSHTRTQWKAKTLNSSVYCPYKTRQRRNIYARKENVMKFREFEANNKNEDKQEFFKKKERHRERMKTKTDRWKERKDLFRFWEWKWTVRTTNRAFLDDVWRQNWRVRHGVCERTWKKRGTGLGVVGARSKAERKLSKDREKLSELSVLNYSQIVLQTKRNLIRTTQQR